MSCLLPAKNVMKIWFCERLLKLSVFGKITVEKFRDFGVLFESGIRMTREAHAVMFVA